MYVLPGRPHNVKVEFKVGEEPTSPTLAAFIVTDGTTEVLPPTTIDVTGNPTEAWISVPGEVNVLLGGQKYRQLRIEVSYTASGMVFTEFFNYYVVPDVMLPYSPRDARQMLGLSQAELPDEIIDFNRSYIDLASGRYAEAFLASLDSADVDVVRSAKELIYWTAIQNVLPTAKLKMLKSIESETSQMSRVANTQSFADIEKLVADKVSYHFSVAVSLQLRPPALLVVTEPSTTQFPGG